jgi:tetratricopeptide (TPR) repeat protein
MQRATLQNAARLLQAGKPQDAERECRAVLKAAPHNLQAARLLGQITRQTGRAAESVQIFHQLRQMRPNDIQLLGELGASLTAANQHAQALPLLQKAVETMPAAVTWKVWLGRCLLQMFRTAQALRILEQAREDAPDDPEATYHLANALLTAGRPSHAEPLVREFLGKHPKSVAGRITLANILEHQARLDEAVAVSREILAEHPTMGAAAGTLARCLRAEGKYDEALAILEPLMGDQPNADQALAAAPVYLGAKRHEEAKAICERALSAPHLPVPMRASLLFSLGQAEQALGRHDEAFRAFRRANDLFPKTFKREHRLRLYQEIRNVFTPEAVRDGFKAEVDASKCVFIVGMPRSGTSLVEQIIDAHPRAHGAGELAEVPMIIGELAGMIGGAAPACLAAMTPEHLNHGAKRYLEHVRTLAPEADVVVDKLPHNFEMLGLIARMLPGARIIHCRRDPIDNCVSCYCTQLSAWHAYSNDLSHLGWAYAQYLRLMDYWRERCGIEWLEVRYEDVVADTEAQARRILQHVGLEWDPRCLEFYKTERRVTTASVDQVREPIYTSSVARWKRYAEQVTPLIESLKAAGVELTDA